MFPFDDYFSDWTDEEFLRHIGRELANPNEFMDTSDLLNDRDFHDRFLAELVARGIADESNLEFQSKLIRENLDPKQAFRGAFINTVREMALAALKRSGQEKGLENIPVGLVDAWDVNAHAIGRPDGGPVIVLNRGLLLNLQLIAHFTIALETWHSETPYRDDFPQGAYATFLLILAQYCVSGDAEIMRQIPKEAFASVEIGGMPHLFASMMEIIILLHEFGHIKLGHIDEEREVESAHDDEFAADMFAFKALIEMIGDSAKPTDIALAFGMLFKFFGLMSLFSKVETDDHPTGDERWDRIKLEVDSEDFKNTLAGQLDDCFAAIYTFIEKSTTEQD